MATRKMKPGAGTASKGRRSTPRRAKAKAFTSRVQRAGRQRAATSDEGSRRSVASRPEKPAREAEGVDGRHREGGPRVRKTSNVRTYARKPQPSSTVTLAMPPGLFDRKERLDRTVEKIASSPFAPQDIPPRQPRKTTAAAEEPPHPVMLLDFGKPLTIHKSKCARTYSRKRRRVPISQDLLRAPQESLPVPQETLPVPDDESSQVFEYAEMAFDVGGDIDLQLTPQDPRELLLPKVGVFDEFGELDRGPTEEAEDQAEENAEQLIHAARTFLDVSRKARARNDPSSAIFFSIPQLLQKVSTETGKTRARYRRTYGGIQGGTKGTRGAYRGYGIPASGYAEDFVAAATRTPLKRSAKGGSVLVPLSKTLSAASGVKKVPVTVLSPACTGVPYVQIKKEPVDWEGEGSWEGGEVVTPDSPLRIKMEPQDSPPPQQPRDEMASSDEERVDYIIPDYLGTFKGAPSSGSS